MDFILDSQSFNLGLLFGVSIFLLYHLFIHSHFKVREGHLAISSIFGKVLRMDQDLKIFQPGFHFKLPWQKIIEVSLMEQMIELSGEEGGTMAMASDGTMLRLDAKLRFTPLKENLFNFVLSIERPIEHIKGIFICLLRNEIANFNPDGFTHMGSYATIRRERRLLNQRIQDFCRQQIGHLYGIHFDGVDLTDILPPDELANALNSVINAQSEAQKLYARTEGECEQRVLAAKKGLMIAKAKASATEQEILTMGTILSSLDSANTLGLYIERRKAEVYAEARASFVKRG